MSLQALDALKDPGNDRRWHPSLLGSGDDADEPHDRVAVVHELVQLVRLDVHRISGYQSHLSRFEDDLRGTPRDIDLVLPVVSVLRRVPPGGDIEHPHVEIRRVDILGEQGSEIDPLCALGR